MNILILSAGSRNKIVQFFKKELNGEGLVYAADCSRYAPAIYDADKYYIVPRINSINYIDTILNICIKENISAVFSLIDPELSLIAKNRDRFIDIGVIPFISDYETVELCFNKFKMYEYCTEKNINTVKTYIDVESFKSDYKNKKIDFPVFVKPIYGSCSINIQKIETLDDLEYVNKKVSGLIIQEFMDGKEIGADVYIDSVSGDVISIFTKEKLLMRAGETDKSISFKDAKLFEFIVKFVDLLKFRGPIDIDIFNRNGKYFISEVNPRFGGGYPHAYAAGCNFIKYIINNTKNEKNIKEIGKYNQNVIMMKYLDTKILTEELIHE